MDANTMVYIGGFIVFLTVIAVVMRYEVRLVLLVSGTLMAGLAGNVLGAVDAFTAQMIHSSLVPTICTVMGFAYVLKLTECDQHLIHMLVNPLKKFNKVLIPGTVIVTAAINVALTSAAGVSAAVGAIMIPILMAAGVHPAMAATAVMAGTFGSTLSPGNSHTVVLEGIVKKHNELMSIVGDTSVVDIAIAMIPTAVPAIIIGAITLTFVAFARKEYTGYVPEEEAKNLGNKAFEVNYLKALVPIFPLALLIIGSKLVGIFAKDVTVPQAMFAGVILAFLVSLKNPQEISKAFFNGLGAAYGDIIGIIIAGVVFTSGMAAIGLTKALIDAMAASEKIVSVAAVFGPMLIAVLCGSGDAATVAFNNAITPHAAMFGMEIIKLGNVASLAGALGRTMSPVAGAAIICAGLAKVNPMEIAKRNALGMLIAALVLMAGLMI